MKSICEIETIPVKIKDLTDVSKLTDINISLQYRLVTILYGREEDGTQTKIKSVMPRMEN